MSLARRASAEFAGTGLLVAAVVGAAIAWWYSDAERGAGAVIVPHDEQEAARP